MAITQESACEGYKVEGLLRWRKATDGKEGRESVQDVAKLIDFCALDGIWLEEIVRHEGSAAFGQGGWVFFRPDHVFGLLEYGCPVLDEELQF